MAAYAVAVERAWVLSTPLLLALGMVVLVCNPSSRKDLSVGPERQDGSVGKTIALQA